jgi:citrate synthase
MNWLNATDALELLGTRPQTLYANVSRGRIAARPDPDDPRRSLYRREDVERLAARQRGRRQAGVVARETIAWGEPILPTAISTIVDGQLYFRGQSAVGLAESASFEEAVRILWDLDAPPVLSSGAVDQPGMAGAYLALAGLAARQMPTPGRSRVVLIADAVETLALVANAFAGPSEGAVHERLARFWKRPEASDAIRRALVLLSEHELNASTFATRIAASTGAPLAAAVLAGIATLSGPLHGSASQSMVPLVAEAQRVGAEAAIGNALRLGQPLPCFGHRLYDGDVRAKALMESFELPALYLALAQAGERLTGEKPNIDFALAALTSAFDLPEDAPLQLFALARTAGWLAHALEQVETGTLIRPRARYVGVKPEGTPT